MCVYLHTRVRANFFQGLFVQAPPRLPFLINELLTRL